MTNGWVTGTTCSELWLVCTVPGAAPVTWSGSPGFEMPLGWVVSHAPQFVVEEAKVTCVSGLQTTICSV